MATDQASQERIGAIVMSVGSIFIAGMEWLDRPEPGEIIEAEPDWYVTFNLLLHGAILVLLLVSLIRLNGLVADRPNQRAPFLVMILVGIGAAAYVVGRDLGMV
jgi:predicted membrane channel-forming protein YqfA (hemolysin III family)